MSYCSASTVKLINGKEIPNFGLGTWKSDPGTVAQAVKDAIDAGYRHIDGAYIYFNENEVGAAIREKIEEGVITRQDIFVTSKLWNTFHRPDLVEPAVRKTLENLQLDYLDLYLIHFPLAWKEDGGGPEPKDDNGKIIYSDVDIVDTWLAMEQLFKRGLVRSIGVSNFNSVQLKYILAYASVVPVINQIECHPYLNQKELVDFCQSRGIAVTGYSPFGSPDRPWADPQEPKLLEDPKILKIAERHEKTCAQVILRWIIQRGMIVIPKSISKNRIVENFNIFDFQLTVEDMELIYGMNRNWRAVGIEMFRDHKDYPFAIPF